MSIASGSFGRYLQKTENTQKISDWVTRNAVSKEDALQKIAMIAHDYNEYGTDYEIHGVLEKFAEPDETLHRGAGDCDCKSGLINAIVDGLPLELKPDVYRVTIGKFFGDIPNPREFHAWNECRVGDTWYILDGTSGKMIVSPHIRYLGMYHIYPESLQITEPITEIAIRIFTLPLIVVNSINQDIASGIRR